MVTRGVVMVTRGVVMVTRGVVMATRGAVSADNTNLRLQYLVVERYTILCLINPPTATHAAHVTSEDGSRPGTTAFPCSKCNVNWVTIGQFMLTAPSADNDTPILYMVLRDPDISLSVHWFKYDKDPLTDNSDPRKKVNINTIFNPT